MFTKLRKNLQVKRTVRLANSRSEKNREILSRTGLKKYCRPKMCRATAKQYELAQSLERINRMSDYTGDRRASEHGRRSLDSMYRFVCDKSGRDYWLEPREM